MNIANHLRVSVDALLVIGGTIALIERRERTRADRQLALPERNKSIDIFVGKFGDGLLLFRKDIGRSATEVSTLAEVTPVIL